MYFVMLKLQIQTVFYMDLDELLLGCFTFSKRYICKLSKEANQLSKTLMNKSREKSEKSRQIE